MALNGVGKRLERVELQIATAARQRIRAVAVATCRVISNRAEAAALISALRKLAAGAALDAGELSIYQKCAADPEVKAAIAKSQNQR